VVVALFPVVGIAVLVSLFVLTVYLAEIEYGLITPAPLIPSLDFYHLAVLTAIMVGFVGFVEELLFRGVLQNVLERRLGLVPGLLLASGIFGLMHSVYGVPMEIVFASGVGVLFGILYDVTDSLVLVSVMHGFMNVFLFGIIPLTGMSSVDLLRATVTRELQRAGAEWVIDILPLLDVRLLVGLL
jgi:membrane protease YdiL (CAAX protease family)